MTAKNCSGCGRFHNPGDGCSNHEPVPPVRQPMPRHGHSIRDNQPRVRHQISRQMRDKFR